MIDRDERVLLFRFDPGDQQPFWATPGGALDKGEDYRSGARRELFEETGIDCDCGEPIAERKTQFKTLEGVEIEADERYFVIRTEATVIDTAGHTSLERRIMREWRWFRLDEIGDWEETVYPENLVDLLEKLMADS